jgi:ABC-2 type transport system ATP-binding protein
MKYALKVSNLTKTYDNGVQALKGVDLKVEEGEFYALLGPNGAGKTTLIGITTGLVNLTSGKVSVFGVDITTNPTEAKTYIGVVPQEMNFNIFERVEDIVVAQAGFYGIGRREALVRAKDILEHLGLWEKRHQKSASLSGGMKRRLMIARALIHKPKILILDEPTAGVDVELRRGMWEYLTKLNQKDGTTIILTTHYLEEAEQLCRKVSIINHGEVIKSGLVKDLLTGMERETLVLDVVAPKNRKFGEQDLSKKVLSKRFHIVDQDTLEVAIESDETINEILEMLQTSEIMVKSIRNKTNRLEEVFVDLISK